MSNFDESTSNSVPLSHGDAAQACGMALERLLAIARQNVDRQQIRRAVGEALRAWPGPPDFQWWAWLVEAGASLGLQLRPIDLTADQLSSLVLHGDAIVLGPNDSRGWLLLESSSDKVEITSLRGEATGHTHARRNLPKHLGLDGSSALRCVVLEPVMQHLPSAHDGKKPWTRLIQLMRPERTEIWMLVVFSLFVGLLNLATPIAVEALVNTVAFGRFLQPVLVLSLILFVFLAFAATIRALQVVVAEVIQRRLFVRVARDLGRRLPRVQQEAFDHEYGPELANRFFDVITIQKTVPTLLLDGLTVILSTAIGMAVLAFYHPWLLGFDLVLLVLMAIAVFGLGRGAIRTSILESKKKYKVAAWLEELARCPTAFRLDGGQEFAADRTDQLVANYLEARRSHFRILMRQVIFSLGLQAIASTALLGLGGWLVITGQLTLGQLVAAELIVAIIVGAFAKLGKQLESMYDVMASVDKLGHLADLPLERPSGLLHHPQSGPAAVTLESITYRHAPESDDHHGSDHTAADASHDVHEHTSLDSLTIKIAPGQRVLVKGPSGSGKSTLADLLFGLRLPHAGQVRIDQIAPREFRPDILRRHVALARSGDFFEGTIAENIHLERPAISPVEVRRALESVGLLDELEKFELGVDTHLSASGGPLTSGQLKRLVLARAIAGNPRLLVVDGVLDSLSERELQHCLRVLGDRQSSWTLVVMTSRDELSAEWDQVVELEESH